MAAAAKGYEVAGVVAELLVEVPEGPVAVDAAQERVANMLTSVTW